MRILSICFISLFLCSCSSLEDEAANVDIGSSKDDVIKAMGPAPYDYTYKNIDVWRYAVVGGFGYCDYREFYIYRDTVISINSYKNGSIAGCTVGLKEIEWDPILSKAMTYDNEHPKTENSNLVQNLKDLSDLKNSGSISDEEYEKAKKSLLNQ